MDHFWFSLFHELSHVALHLGKDDNDCFLDDLDVNGKELEEEADELARNSLIPSDAWSQFPNMITTINVLNFADSLRIHPAIVAGRIRWERKNYRILSRLVKSGGVRRFFHEFTSN